MVLVNIFLYFRYDTVSRFKFLHLMDSKIAVDFSDFNPSFLLSIETIKEISKAIIGTLPVEKLLGLLRGAPRAVAWSLGLVGVLHVVKVADAKPLWL